MNEDKLYENKMWGTQRAIDEKTKEELKVQLDSLKVDRRIYKRRLRMYETDLKLAMKYGLPEKDRTQFNNQREDALKKVEKCEEEIHEIKKITSPFKQLTDKTITFAKDKLDIAKSAVMAIGDTLHCLHVLFLFSLLRIPYNITSFHFIYLICLILNFIFLLITRKV